MAGNPEPIDPAEKAAEAPGMTKELTAEKKKVGRKLVAVRSDLVQEIIRMANRKGRTVYSFVNEVVEQAIKAEAMGTSLKEIMELHEFLELERKAGGTIIKRDIMSYLIQKVYPQEKENLLEKWYDSGVWYGKYLLIKFDKENLLEILQKLFHSLAWDVTDISILTKKDSLHLRCVTIEHRTIEQTELFTAFLEGVMHSLGYETVEKDFLKGLILLNFKENINSCK